MSNNDWKKSPWIIALGAAVAGSLVSFILDISKDKPIFSTIWSWLVWIWNIIVTFLNLNIRVWWLILGLFLIFIILWIISNINRESIKTRTNFLNYKEDTLKKWKWGWGWEYDQFKKKWYVLDMHPYCPQCSTRLMEPSLYSPYKCPRCNFSASHYSEYKDEIEHLILDNIEKGNYPKN